MSDHNKPDKEQLQIVYEDDDLFLINKRSRIHSAIVAESDNLSVAQILTERDNSLSEVSSKAEDAGLVNRLDYETSGLLLAAKGRNAWISLRASLLSESVYKSYLCLLEGRLEKDSLVDNFIGARARTAKSVRVLTREPKKKERALPAKSEFKPIAYHAELDATATRVVIQCARRHQVRAHAKFLGHPLVGDEVYGSSRVLSEVLKVEAPPFLLHAERIKFVHPSTEEIVDISAPLDDRLRGIFDSEGVN